MRPKIGIVGTGQTVGIAHYHTMSLLADGRAEIAAVYNSKPDLAAAFLTDHGLEQARVCGSYSELLDAVDAVDICSPNSTHIDYVLQAVQADKHIFVEKPLALNARDSYQAVKALEGRNLFNMVGFVYRYAYAAQELRKLVENEIGRVYTFAGSFGGRRLADPDLPLEWRMVREHSGTGALGDFGSHLVDLADFTAGLRFDAVNAMTSTVVPERPANPEGLTQVENDDQAAFTASTAANALASFTVSRVGMDAMNLLIAGEGGLLRLSFANPQVINYLPAPGGKYGAEPKEIPVRPQVFFDGWFDEQMKAFVDGLLGEDVPAAADMHQGHYVQSVLDAAEKASQQNPFQVALC